MTWRKYVSLLMLPPTLAVIPFLMLFGSKLLLLGMAWEASMMFALGSLFAGWAVLLFVILNFPATANAGLSTDTDRKAD